MRKDRCIVNFPIVRFPGGGVKGGKLLYQWGEINYIVLFPTPGIPIFRGGNSSSEKIIAVFPGERRGWVYARLVMS